MLGTDSKYSGQTRIAGALSGRSENRCTKACMYVCKRSTSHTALKHSTRIRYAGQQGSRWKQGLKQPPNMPVVPLHGGERGCVWLNLGLHNDAMQAFAIL